MSGWDRDSVMDSSIFPWFSTRCSVADQESAVSSTVCERYSSPEARRWPAWASAANSYASRILSTSRAGSRSYTVPRGTTHSVGWFVTAAMRSKCSS
jgi:hypothetical protein